MFMLLGCSNNETIAQDNIEKHLLQNIKKDAIITSKEYSKLYIITPDNRDNIPDADTSKIVEEFGSYFSLYTIPLDLVLSGCSLETFENIIKNDDKFREWKTGGEEYVMLGFFEIEDKFLDKENIGLCFRLDSTLNIYKPYQIKDTEAVYKLSMLDK